MAWGLLDRFAMDYAMNGTRLGLLMGLLLGAGGLEALAQEGATAQSDLSRVRTDAERGIAEAQNNLGCYYAFGRQGVITNEALAVKWWRKSASQNYVMAQNNLASYLAARGGEDDVTEAVKWWQKSAEQGDQYAQTELGLRYLQGRGVAKDNVQAAKWLLLVAKLNGKLQEETKILERLMTHEQVEDGLTLARNFRSREEASPKESRAEGTPEASGSGFFITDDGWLITNEHVVHGNNRIRVNTGKGLLTAKVIKVDSVNDLALLRVEGRFEALPVTMSRIARLGSTVATVGFPNIGLQGFAPKLAKGEIAALSGAADDPRYFQISVPVQPGNSGGALVDERGNIVGVVSAKLDAVAALRTSGALPEHVNYAVKSSFLLSFLESVPEVIAKLKEPNTTNRKFEDVVKSAEDAAVLVLVY
jgi:S1-C subfamily serine protease